MTTPAEIQGDYFSILGDVGEEVLIRRYTSSGTNRTKMDIPVRARVTGYVRHELVGTMQQGDRLAICLAEDLTKPTTDSPPQTLTLPVTTADKIIVRGKELQIIAMDDSTRRVHGELIAIEITARG